MRSRPEPLGRIALAILALGIAVAAVDRLRQTRAATAQAAAITGGDPQRGRTLMLRYGCSTCHDTPGVWPRARGVGPPLDEVAGRVYLAGAVVNTPRNLIAWIVDPKAFDPDTAMPVTGISEAEARDVAAFLYSHR